MPDRLSFDIKADELDKNHYVTLFFFIKIYGFVHDLQATDGNNDEDSTENINDERTLVIFDSRPNHWFYIAYDPTLSEQSWYVFAENRRIFEYKPFREDEFGHWTPISIAWYREHNRPYTINMVQCGIKYNNWGYRSNGTQSTWFFPYWTFKEFTVTNKWVGMLSDLQIFNTFIVDAWGLVKGNTYTDADKYLFLKIPMKTSIDTEKCVQQAQILSSTSSGFEIQCLMDHNPHWFQCGNIGANYLDWTQGTGTKGHCTGTCGNSKRCLGNPAPGSGRYENASCDHKDLDYAAYYLFLRNDKIVCDYWDTHFMNYARFKKVDVPEVKNPPIVWSIDFWFYTQSYHNSYDPVNAGGTSHSYMNNFDSIIIYWDFHLKLIVKSTKVNSNWHDNTYEFTATCYPMTDKKNPQNDGTPIEISWGTSQKWWRYISCGVDWSRYLFFLTNVNKKQNERTFIQKNVLPFGKVKFGIEETSPNGYGVTFISQLRLWNCYSCSPGFRNYHYDQSFNFNNMLHWFDGKNENGQFVDSCVGTEVKSIMIDQVVDFYGNNVLDNIGMYLICDETFYTYYRDGATSCDTMFNLARTADFEFEIPSSRTNRYTMEFWAYVEETQQLTSGLNVIWDNHMSITLIRDPNQSTTLLGLCLPQAYRDKIDGLSGQLWYSVYDNAINKEQYSFHAAGSTWIFVRCAIDGTRKKMYMNDGIEEDLLSEPLYGDITNYRPFRFFDHSRYVFLKFQNAKKNYTRIFWRGFRAYREYMTQNLMNIKYIYFDGYFGSGNFFWPIVINIDFQSFSSGACSYLTNLALKYSINDETRSYHSYHCTYWQESEDVYYPTYPSYYVVIFCMGGETGGDNTPCGGNKSTFGLQSTTKFFYPSSGGRYLNMATLEQASSCPAGYTRWPDSEQNRAYCWLNCNINNIDTCANTDAEMSSLDNYNKWFTCKPNYTRVYYECISNDLIINSAMYFSSFFAYNDMIMNTLSKNIKSYYFEFWFKWDQMNYREAVKEQKYYLLAPPHLLLQDNSDQIFKYANTQISGGTFLYSLTSLSIYEWNRVIIKTVYDNTFRTFTINVFINYDFVNAEITISNIDGTWYDMTLQGIGFCTQPFSYCVINNITYNISWGTAWYRNIRVWKESTSSTSLIQACEIGYTQLLKSQLLYFQFTIEYINNNRIWDRTNPSQNYLWNNFWFNTPRLNYDNDMRQNYSTNNFDYAGLNPGSYITGLNSAGTNYVLSDCDIACKRCYSPASSNCYECQPGFSLYGKACKVSTGYYFKTPSNRTNAINTEMKLDTNILTTTLAFNIENQNPITITIWMKYFGITWEAPDQKYYPIFSFYSTSFFGYDSVNESFVVVVEGVEAFSVPIREYVGEWTHFGWSVHRSANPNPYAFFPQMVNFMINQKIIIPVTSFKPRDQTVRIDRIVFAMVPIAYFSEMKFYKNFWFGTYGHINALSSLKNVDLIYEVKFSGSASDNCIVQVELDSSLNIGILKPVCSLDYHPFDDINNLCKEDDNYMDLSLPSSPPCGPCNDICLTQCFNTADSIMNCSCNYYEGLYWVAEIQNALTQPTNYYCQKVDNINFSFYESMTVQGLNKVQNDEMTLEIWAYIYQYKTGGFDNIDIIWNKHVRIRIISDGTNLTAKCIPNDVNNAGLSMDENINFGVWHNIRCMADSYFKRKIFRIQIDKKPENAAMNYEPDYTGFNDMISSNLAIVDNTLTFNYGFSFVRDVKLWSSYNFHFWFNGAYDLAPKNFGYLLHYFKNGFNVDALYKARIYDHVMEYPYEITLKPNRIGYNYVVGYESLLLCWEGYCYSSISKRCEVCMNSDCIDLREEFVPGDPVKCLRCPLSAPFLSKDDKCVKDCSPFFYNDEYWMQCRACDNTCYTCFGKLETNCLKCIDPYYWYEAEYRCVLDCWFYGLTPFKDADGFNVCVPFTAQAVIIQPDISIPIDHTILTQIVAQITMTTYSKYTTEWRFMYTETLELNKDYRGFTPAMIPNNIETAPFTSDPTLLTVNTDPNFFTYGLKYFFYLRVTAINIEVSDSKIHEDIPFILTMNDLPILNLVNILPKEGYTSTKFLFTCNKCVDDNTDKPDWQYRFTYSTTPNDFVNEVDIAPIGFNSKSERLMTFPDIGTYYVKCYCKDKMEAVDSWEKSFNVHWPPWESGVNIPIMDSIDNIDWDERLTSEQLSNRAEFLATITVDYPKDEIWNRTNITSNTLTGFGFNNWLTLKDPVSTMDDSFCNKRGSSYPINKYLYCDCMNYVGIICQIDGDSLNNVIKIYDNWFGKVNELQTTTYDSYLLNAIHKIILSGSYFLTSEQIPFAQRSIDYISLSIQRFQTEMTAGDVYKTYFDVYNYWLEYGWNLINKFKFTNFIEENSKLQTGVYDYNLVREAKLELHQVETMNSYFDRVKMGWDSLMKFYIDEKVELTYVNKNLNVYIALWNENFNFKTFFYYERSMYEPYFDVSKCISNVMKRSSATTYKIFMKGIVWKVSPYMPINEWYYNNTTPVISLEFYDYKTNKLVYWSDCGYEHEVELYFPIAHYAIAPRINWQRELVSPENQYALTDSIFSDPVYINSKGQVFDTTPEERRRWYFLPFNLTCHFFDGGALSREGCEYSLYDQENFVLCKCLHLTDFVVQHYEIDGNFKLSSRFFYLKHYMLLMWKGNYPNNPSLYFFLAIAGLYFFVLISYAVCDCYMNAKLDWWMFLKTSIIKTNLPYKDNYDFIDKIVWTVETKQRWENAKQRNPDNFEEHMDVNNIDVEIMADNITKYNKEYKQNPSRNANQNDFFNQRMKKTNVNTNSGFFKNNDTESNGDEDDEDGDEDDDDSNNNEVNSKSESNTNTENYLHHPQSTKGSNDIMNIHRETPQKKMKRMNKFFQVGFSGFGTDAKAGESKKYNIKDQDRDSDDNRYQNDSEVGAPKKGRNKGKVTVQPIQSILPGKKANKQMGFFNTEESHLKETNPFQEGYDTYIPKFEKPKVVSVTLDFFHKENNGDDGDGDDDDGKNGKNKNGKNKFDTENRDAEMRLGHTQNRTELDFGAGNKEELPKWFRHLTHEKRLWEYDKLPLSLCTFFEKNLKNRHVVFSTFARFSLLYPRYKRIGNFFAQVSLYMFFLSIFFTADENMEITKNPKPMVFILFVLYCVASMMGSCIFVHLPGFMFYINPAKYRDLYNTIREKRGWQVIKDYQKLKASMLWWNWFGIIIQWFYVIVSFYFAFGHCATYVYQNTTFFIAFFVTVIGDLLIWEVFWEFVVASFFSCRRAGRCTIQMGEFFNRMRNMKHLV